MIEDRDPSDHQGRRFPGIKAGLNADEAPFRRIKRNRALLDDDNRAVSDVFNKRQTLEAHGKSSARVSRPSRSLALPQPTRWLNMLHSIGSILASHIFRAINWRPEVQETNAGLTLRASMREPTAIGGPGSLLLVVSR